MKVAVDESLCIGCSLCITEVPDVFELGDDGLAKVKQAEPTGETATKAQEMASQCPVNAILIHE